MTAYMPTSPTGMHRRKMTPTPSQEYEIDLFVAGAWVLVGYSQHPETAGVAAYWTFTSVEGTTWTERHNRHYFGMLRLKEEYGISMQAPVPQSPCRPRIRPQRLMKRLMACR